MLSLRSIMVVSRLLSSWRRFMLRVIRSMRFKKRKFRF